MTTSPALSPSFVDTIKLAFGADGERWLDELPALLSVCARRWSLTLAPPFPGLSYNYAAPARLPDGTDVVIKVGVPRAELATEIAALEVFGGRGCVRLLAADANLGSLLLERLRPGTMLSTLGDEDGAARIAAAVAQALWQPPPADLEFPTVANWAVGLSRLRARFAGGTGPLPADLVSLAEALFRDLLADGVPPRLLHGDLHHYNILATTSRLTGWAAIDPKGVIGDPAYDLGAFLYNPLPDFPARPDLAPALARRVAVLAEALGFDERRIAAWGVAQAVLSACWSIEDGFWGDWPTLRVAEALAPMALRRPC